MLDSRNDQAAGLRRLFGRRPARAITVTSGSDGVGRTTVVINLAAALAARGRRVLVIDENGGPSGVAASLGAPARRDLLDVASGLCTLEDALVAAPCEITVLPAADAVRALPQADVAAQARLAAVLARLGERYDFVLIDALRGTAGSLELPGDATRDVVVACSARYAAITGAYAVMKQLHQQRGRSALRCHLLLNRVAGGRAANVIFDNLESLARDRLGIPLERLACVPKDEHVTRAARMLQPVVAAFPATPAALRFRAVAETTAGWRPDRERAGSLDRLLRRLLPSASPALEAA